jgi:hypothetical protein
MNEGREKKSFGFLPYAAVVLVAALAVFLVFFLTRSDSDEPSSSESDVSSTEETKAPVSVQDALAMEDLIRRYYDAKMEADAETLNRIVVSDKEYNAADLASDANIIEKYDNYKTYMVTSDEEDYFIVYVTYDMYFLGIKEGAPALNRFVLKRDGSGFVIYDRFVSQTFEDGLMETEETAVVKNLKKQVEDDLQAACEANGYLKELMKFLEGNVEETEPETESSEEETETEGGSDESESAESLEGSEEGSGTGGGSEDGESNSMEETEPPEEDRHN